MMISQKNSKGWRNPWVFGLLAIILSGVLINARFLWGVLNHPVRVLDDNYSVKAHNKVDAKWVQQQSERSTLGWKTSLHSPQQIQNDSSAPQVDAQYLLLGQQVDFKFSLKDKEGQAVQGGRVDIKAQWPGDPTYDFASSLKEVSAGNYEGRMNFSRSGNWDLLIRAERDGRQFDTEQKVFVGFSK
jgi:hypothetical protein